jgi:SAM-dependent methyltransferase
VRIFSLLNPCIFIVYPDVGHGTGESLLLLLTEPSIPQPSHLVGITSLPLHHERSLARVLKLQTDNPKANETKVELFGTDAVYKPAAPQSSAHPLNPDSHYVFDTILALDCAYHFRTRRLFLEQSLAKLSPGGTIALADICVASSGFGTKILTKVLKMMPEENVISEENHVRQMKEIGYVDVQSEDVTEYVVPGFVEFLKTRGWTWGVFASVFVLYVKAGMRIVIVRGSKPI